MAGAQIGGKIGSWVDQFAQVDDALDVGVPCRLGKIAGHLQVAVRAGFTALLAMDQIVGCRNALHGIHQGTFGEGIPRDNFHPFQPGTALQAARVTHQAADAVARIQQARHQPPADISGCAGDKNEVGLWHDEILSYTFNSML